MITMSGKKIDDFEAFKIYLAMKSHFNSEYDFIKYKGKVSPKKETYYNRRDRRTFEELSRRFDKKSLEEFLLALFLNVTENGNLAISRNEFMWTGNLLDKESYDTYKNWKKRIQSIKYTFTNDCHVLFTRASEENIEFNSIFKSIDNDYPFIVFLEKRGELSLETLIIFEKIFTFIDKVKINDTTYWPIYTKKVKDYMSFLDIDVNYYVNVLRDILIDDYYEDYGQLIKKTS